MTATDGQTAAQRIAEAEGVLDGLRESLAETAGIVLPSLQLHYSTWSGAVSEPGLIELGACALDTARALTGALRASQRAQP